MIRPLIAIAGITAGVAATAGTASAQVPNCGGQNAAPQPVPYTCVLPGRDITHQGVTRHFSAVVVADGTRVTVTYTMSAPLPVNVPIRIVHHEGISGAGGTENESQGFILAGSVTATLVDSAPCRDGQLDVKAVNITNGSGDAFRVGGPWIQNGTGCNQVSTTTTPSSSSVPPSTSVTTPTQPSPTAPSTTSTVGGGTSSRALPATGSNTVWMVLGAFAFILVGTVLITRRVS